MTPEQKVTSRELSEKLRDAGAKQESEWCHEVWLFPVGVNVPTAYLYRGRPKDVHNRDYFSAFDCAELFEGLPTGSSVVKNLDGSYSGVSDPFWKAFEGLTPVEVLGELRLWCLENGHIKEAKP